MHIGTIPIYLMNLKTEHQPGCVWKEESGYQSNITERNMVTPEISKRSGAKFGFSIVCVTNPSLHNRRFIHIVCFYEFLHLKIISIYLPFLFVFDIYSNIDIYNWTLQIGNTLYNIKKKEILCVICGGDGCTKYIIRYLQTREFMEIKQHGAGSSIPVLFVDNLNCLIFIVYWGHWRHIIWVFICESGQVYMWIREKQIILF